MVCLKTELYKTKVWLETMTMRTAKMRGKSLLKNFHP